MDDRFAAAVRDLEDEAEITVGADDCPARPDSPDRLLAD
jgi:hypothetical protein